ncbi:MAG: SLBB domain-containing protein [Fibrobacterota bacterium]|nr:MAG: SLBB domain-containing protein [Fibrobacterota bacterium]
MTKTIKLAILLAFATAEAQHLEQVKSSQVASSSINLLRKSDLPIIPVPDSAFRLSTGDQLRLRWWGIGSQDIDLVVDTRGDIILPDIGRIPARGIIFRSLRDSIETLIRRRTRATLIDLQIIKIVPAQIQIVGTLKYPGIYELPAGTRLSNALAIAGIDIGDLLYQLESGTPMWTPLKSQEPSLRKVLVLHGGHDSAWYDLISSKRNSDPSQDPPVFFGDRIILLPRGKVVQISEGTNFPDRMEIVEGESIQHLLRAIGEDSSSKVQIESNSSTQFANVIDPQTTIIRFPPKKQNPKMNCAWVLGNVRAPGAYNLSGKMTAEQIISAAGGVIGGNDSGVVVSIKRDWTWLTPARDRSSVDATQYPEIKAAMFSYLTQTRGTYVDTKTPLLPGDTVLAYPLEPVVWVGGEVRNPGFVTWKKDQTIDFYIDEAGGYSNRPWISRTKLFDLQSGQARVGENQIVRPGSAIIVPEKRFITTEQWVGIVVSIGSFALTATALVITLGKN